MLLITCSNPQVTGFSGMSLVVFTPGGPLYLIKAFSYKYRHIATYIIYIVGELGPEKNRFVQPTPQ